MSETTVTQLEIRMWLDLLARLLRRSLDRQLAEQEPGLRALQYLVLRFLSLGPSSNAEISRRFHHDANTLVQTLDSLSRAGLIARQPDPADRRRTIVAISDLGQRTLARLPTASQENPLSAALSAMPPEQVDTLRDLLRQLGQALSDTPDAATELAQLARDLVRAEASTSQE
jgi:DNA-binding MarR family transcriptional regulator